MTNLSPAAQAVLDAWSDNTRYTRDKEPQALAAALRAALDHVLTAQQILDIAAELEAQ
jgi:hypothetical protein